MSFAPYWRANASAWLAMAAGLLWLACNKVPPDGEGGLDSQGLASQALQTLAGTAPRWTPTASMARPRGDHTATLLRDGKVLVVGGRSGGGSLPHDSVEMYDPATGLWTTLSGELNIARTQHTATLLRNGKVLVVGGVGPTDDPLASAELYDPATGAWILTGNQPSTARESHSATLLKNGKVLIVGGLANGSMLKSVELYDPDSDTWLPQPDLNEPRYLHTATLLRNGKVFVAGGLIHGNRRLDGRANTEIYDPDNPSWMRKAPMQLGRFHHTATLLPDGKVLVVGGQFEDFIIVIGEVCAARKPTEVYDPSRDRWDSAGSLGAPRTEHMAVLLANGKVLIAGGLDLVDDILNGCRVYEYFNSSEAYNQGSWTTVTHHSGSRTRHTMTLLPNGRVLMTGGWNGGTVQSNAELYLPGEEEWTALNAPAPSRIEASATLLPDGTVLVAGGRQGTPGTALDNASTYNPDSRGFTDTGPLNEARSQHTATLLVTGKVLVVGGKGPSDDALNSTELYEPAHREWTRLDTASLTESRSRHTATLLPGGPVLIAGGEGTGGALNSAEVYDPGNHRFTATGSMIWRRSLHTATPLPGGKVLVVGGKGPSDAALDSVELYDPATHQWTPLTSSLAEGRWLHTTTLLPDGRVLIVGGKSSDGALASAELYDLVRGRWADIGSLNQARFGHTTTWLPSGRVLVAGGYGANNTPLQSAEVYDPATRQWTYTAGMAAAHSDHAATLLPSGKVFVFGGRTGAGAEVYNDLSVCQQCLPVITPIPGPQVPGQPLTLTGSNLSGVSEASNGTTQSSATNFPLVSLRAVEGGALTRLEPQLSYSDGALTIEIPPVPDGYYILSVTAHAASGSTMLLVDGPPLTPPTLTAPRPDSFANSTQPTIQGSTDPGRKVTVWLNGGLAGTTLAASSGDWAFRPGTELAQTSHQVFATAADPLGNVSAPTQTVTFTVDTLTPEAPVVNAPGALVNVQRPMLAGTAEPGSTVTVSLDDTVVDRRPADGLGAWSLTPATDLAEGSHVVTATATDAAGNISPSSSPLLFTVDTLAPEPPEVSSPGAFVNTQQPLIGGTAEAGSTVTVWRENTELGTATANPSGGWAFRPTSALPQGPHELTATATDAVGNVSPLSGAHPFMVDTGKPDLPRLSAPGRFVNTQKPIIAGTAEPGSSVTVRLNGTEELGTVIANSTGDWALIPATKLEERAHEVTATATDKAGNASDASPSLGFTVDITAPLPPEMGEPAAFVNTHRPLMTGTAEALSEVTIFVDGAKVGSTPAAADRSWRFTPTADLVEGPHQLWVTATDAAGNVGAPLEPRSLTVDTLQPLPPTLSGPDAFVNVRNPVIRGTAEEGTTVTVWLNGRVAGTPTADPQGNWSCPTQELQESPHEVSATAMDAAGNLSFPSFIHSFTVDLTPPPTPLVNGPAAYINVTNPVIRGTAEPRSRVTVWLDGAEVATVTANEVATWLYSPTEQLSSGDHDVKAAAEDAAGNVSETSAVYGFTVDLARPDAPMVSAPGASVSSPRPVIAGTAEAGSTVTVTVDEKEIGKATTDESGNWSLTPLIKFAAGQHTVSATAQDQALNESDSSAPQTFLVRASHYGWGCSSSAAFPVTWAMLVLAGALGRRRRRAPAVPPSG